VEQTVIGGNAEIAYRAALTEVLRTLSGAPFDLEAILDAVLEHATRLCRADRGFVYLLRDGLYRHVADVNAPPEIVAFNIAHPIAPGRGTMTGRAALEGRTVHAPDVLLDPEYTYHEAQRLGGFRATLAVPMLREGLVVGVINMLRDEPRPFSEAEIELVGSFADQAVIALAVTNQARTIERQRSELARFLSPQVSSLIASPAAETLLAPHRRVITVVFCDLRGFTAFSESAAPEDVMAVLHDYHAALGGRVAEFGATLERYTGDGLMAFFNDPVEQPDHAARAARMAIEMRNDVRALQARWRRSGFELGFGVGITTGYATLGRIGTADRADYAAVGSVVNLAARLCAEAEDGEVLLAERAHVAIEPIAETGPVRQFVVKGVTRPVAAVNLVAIQDAT
jgi:class 3 adenylate cyclase